MVYNTSDFVGQISWPFNYSKNDSYHFDSDPDLHVFLFDASNLCSFYKEKQLNDLCVALPPCVFSTFQLNIRNHFEMYV